MILYSKTFLLPSPAISSSPDLLATIYISIKVGSLRSDLTRRREQTFSLAK